MFSPEVAATFADMEREVVNASRGYEVVCCSGLSVDLMINVATDLEIELQVRREVREKWKGEGSRVEGSGRGRKRNELNVRSGNKEGKYGREKVR